MVNTVLDDVPDDDDDDVGIDLDRPASGGSRGRPAPADDEDDEDADDEDDSDDGKPADAKDKKPADGKSYTQSDIDKLNEVVSKERESARELRRKLREAKKTQPAPAAADGADSEDALAQARSAGHDDMKMVAIAAKAEALFLAAGLQNASPGRVARLVKQINSDEVDVDVKSGVMDGLEDQVDAVVDEYPELFTPPKIDEAEKPKPRRIPRGDGSDRRPAKRDEPKLTTGELHALRVQQGR